MTTLENTIKDASWLVEALTAGDINSQWYKFDFLSIWRSYQIRRMLAMEEKVGGASAKQFVSTTSEDREKLLEDAIPKNTKSSTTQWVKNLEPYCRSKKDTEVNFSTIELADLAVLFESFYADLRRKDGEQYRRNSLMACRSALHRHLSHHRPSVNLFVDGVFSKSNKVLDSVLKAKKKAGSEPAVNHKQPISDDDWKLIQEHFADISTTLDPRKLTTYGWFVVSSHFCLRGGEVQCKLKKQDLLFESGRLTLATDFMTKNHRGGLTGSASTTAGCIKDAVQVAAIQRYVSKLHTDLDRLFQRARAHAGMLVSENDECWFMRSPLSHNLLDGMMKGLSHAAGTSRAYTNHCLTGPSPAVKRWGGQRVRWTPKGFPLRGPGVSPGKCFGNSTMKSFVLGNLHNYWVHEILNSSLALVGQSWSWFQVKDSSPSLFIHSC